MAKGRPPLSGDERMVHLTVRIPMWVHERLKRYGNSSHAVRRILEHYLGDRD